MGDKESGGPSSGGTYGKKWLRLRRLTLLETGAIKYHTEVDMIRHSWIWC